MTKSIGHASIPPEGNVLTPQAFACLLPLLSQQSRDLLLPVLNDRSLRGCIPRPEVDAVLASERKSASDLMVDLLPVAQLRSRPPISHYRVGVLAQGASGSLYLGANLEVPGQMLGFSVHGEQSALANSFMHEETGITSLAVTAAPCGHCRQFLNESANGADLDIFVKGNRPAKLAALLPEAFGPNNLGITARLFSGKKADLKLPAGIGDHLATAALEAARKAYSPYSNSLAGVAVVTAAGVIYKGAYIENVAFNPSLSPLQVALVSTIMAGEQPDQITEAVLVELEDAPISQLAVTRMVLEAMAPRAHLRRLTARA